MKQIICQCGSHDTHNIYELDEADLDCLSTDDTDGLIEFLIKHFSLVELDVLMESVETGNE